MSFKTNLKLASFDGGGILGLSQLEIMNHIIHQLNWDENSKESDGWSLPCEHFDLMGGSGTGGLIAILFAKLRMSVEEASEEFYEIINHVFKPENISASQRTEALRKCMEDILEKKGLPVDLQLTANKQEDCASFVLASSSANFKRAVSLRSYFVRRQPPSPITVIEAVLATCATQPEFAPVSSGSGHTAREYIAASGSTNPIYEVIAEAHLLFGGNATVASLLSLGTWRPPIIPFRPNGYEAVLHRIMRDMQECERRAQEVEDRIGRVRIYSRFSVDQEMQKDQIGQLDGLGWITARTEDYLSRHESGQRLDLLAHNFGVEQGLITLDQLKHAEELGSHDNVAVVLQRSAETLISNQDDEIIAKLKPKDLEYGSLVDTCLEGTRQYILEKIRIWATDLQAPNILWINGDSGVGKSAIASTIVEELRLSNRLGSSFFFRWERAGVMTPNALWRTVAYGLAQRYPDIRGHLVTALTINGDLPEIADVDALFRQLVYEPLMKSDRIPAEKLPVIVLDAVDECGGLDGQRSDSRKALIQTLRRWSELPAGFKLIITSRRESDIEQLFSTTVHHSIEIAAKEPITPFTPSNIRVFLVHELRQIQARYTSLPLDWPGEKAILSLIDRSRGLFIWIKTVANLIKRGAPRRTLRQILSHDTEGMSGLYTWILHASFPDSIEEDTKDFRAVLGAVIFMKEPFDNANLARFLSIDEPTMEYIFTELQSVLDCGTTVRIYHRSFVDFLLDSNDCPAFFLINKEYETSNLALCCLYTMETHLKFNICELESSSVRNEDVPNLVLRIDKCIPPYLSYSSRYWASHLAETAPCRGINNSLQCFMDDLFLAWLEVLSLTKQMDIVSSMLQCLVDWLRITNQEDSLAVDMQKFVATFASAMSESAPHIYISALPFSPRYSGVSKQYIRHYPQTLTVKRGGYNSWPVVQINEAGQKDHTVEVIGTETGETVVGPLQGHITSVYSVSFSPDGRRIVSGSLDDTIRVWNSETGETILGPLMGHGGPVYSASFSPDGKRIVSGSGDHTLRVWDAETGQMVLGPLQGHNNCIWSASFSPDGRSIISGSADHTIRVWNAATGKRILGPLRGHNASVSSVLFSPDGRRIVSGSDDHTIRVWDAATGKTILGPLQGHSASVRCVSVSPDGTKIVSGSEDNTIQVWDATTGDTVTDSLQGHNDLVWSVSFSPDGRRIVSGSEDRTIRIWDAETGETVLGPMQGHRNSVNSVSFSPGGGRIVSGSDDCTVRVWDAELDEAITGGWLFPFGSDLEVLDTCLKDRLTDASSKFRNIHETMDGWVLGPNSELLFWVPPAIRPRLCPPNNVLVIDNQQVWTIVDLMHFVHGEEWSRCKECRPTWVIQSEN